MNYILLQLWITERLYKLVSACKEAKIEVLRALGRRPL